MLQKRREPVFYYWFPLFCFHYLYIIHITKAVELVYNQPQITVTKTSSGRYPCCNCSKDALEPYRGLPPETYIIGLGTQPVTAPWYHRHWAEFWRKHEQAHPITRTYTRVRNGKQYTYHQTDWVADVCAHQFHHEYERARLMRLPCRLVGHANQKNDPRSVPALESK